MAAETTLRDSLNTQNPNRAASAAQDLELGELMTLLINGLTATETGVAVTTHVATLATTPTQLFQVNATTATVTGVKKLLKGRTDPDGTIQPVPATGEATWNGGTKVRFATADVATVASFTYASAATSTPSYLRRAIGENP